MSASIIVSWFMVVLMLIISIILLIGKGSFFIAGYNTSTKEEKEKYDKKKLCRIMGVCLSLITVILALYTLYEFQVPTAMIWLVPWGLFIIVAVTMILANTIGKKKSSRY